MYKEYEDQLVKQEKDVGIPALYCIGLITQNKRGALNESNDIATEINTCCKVTMLAGS